MVSGLSAPHPYAHFLQNNQTLAQQAVPTSEQFWQVGMVHPGLQSLLYLNQAAAAMSGLPTGTAGWPKAGLMNPTVVMANAHLLNTLPGNANFAGQFFSTGVPGFPPLQQQPPQQQLGQSPVSVSAPAASTTPDPRRSSIDALRLKAKEHSAALDLTPNGTISPTGSNSNSSACKA